MRTTIRIDDDLLSKLKSRAASERISLTRLVNRVLRTGLASSDRVADDAPFEETTFAMGAPLHKLHKAGLLAEALEDQETLRKLRMRK